MAYIFIRVATVFIAACAFITCAVAQNSIKKDCPPADQMKAEQLFGAWAVRFASPPAGLPATATLLLERHAEFSDSLAGVVVREMPRAKGKAAAGTHASQAQLAGDLDGGSLLLDESSDNVSITGTWNGEMVEGSCGKIFRGTWKDTSANAPANAPDLPFTLTKKP
jgi:hypothetical protein